MVLHVKTIRVEDAVRILVDTVELPSFRTTPESQHILDDSLVAAQIQANLVQEYPTSRVSCRDGEVFINVVAPVTVVAPLSAEQEAIERIRMQCHESTWGEESERECHSFYILRLGEGDLWRLRIRHVTAIGFVCHWLLVLGTLLTAPVLSVEGAALTAMQRLPMLRPR